MNPSSNIFLIGPMGAGKSTVGRRIARALGLRFVDLDQVIENDVGSSIPLIFELQGESAFRARESETLRRVCVEDGIVLATGGGSVLAEDNREVLRRRGFVVYLEATVDLQLAYEIQSGPAKGLTVLFQGNNLTKTAFQRFRPDTGAIVENVPTGKTYLLGLNYKL